MTVTAGQVAAELARLREIQTNAHKRCRSPLSSCPADCAKHPPWPSSETWDRPGPASPSEWEGLARMAAARRHAGQPLTTIDVKALTRAERGAA